MLAGLLKAPTRYAPTNNLKRSQERANLIIGLMENQNFLSKAEAKFARENPATLSKFAQRKQVDILLTGSWQVFQTISPMKQLKMS